MDDNRRPWSPPQIIWSALIAIVVWSAVGFNWFGHGFDWTTQGNAERISVQAVKESQATMCVAQARSAPDAKAALAEFAKLARWKQTGFVETARWATMPGSDSALHGVAELCAARLRGS